MNAEDFCEIVNLLNLYGFAVDTLNWDLFDRVFTPDTQVDYPNGVWNDLASFKEDFAVAHAPLKTTQHMVTNHQVVVTGDTANAISYARARLIRIGPDGSDEPWEFGGWYDDILVHTKSGWRIKRRMCRGNWLDGSANVITPAVAQSVTILRRAAAAGDIAYLETVKAQSDRSV